MDLKNISTDELVALHDKLSNESIDVRREIEKREVSWREMAGKGPQYRVLAIVLCRTQMKLSLKEAKDTVDVFCEPKVLLKV